MRGLETSLGKPAVVLGDLNVAFRDLDVYNFFAPHLKKQAGCTAGERAAFGAWLDSGYVDAFRLVHGDVSGAFTYWYVVYLSLTAIRCIYNTSHALR